MIMNEDEAPTSSQYPWTVMVTGVSEAEIDECAVAAAPLPIVSVECAAAPKHMLKLLPIVVIVGEHTPEDVLRDVQTRASITRCALVFFEQTRSDLALAIHTGISRAEALRAAARSMCG